MENYFNYFTEIEECFRRCRKTPSLLSTLDWALIEAWKEAGIPLEAVLAGIERTFQKAQKRPRAARKVKSLAYCSPEVLRAAAGAGDAPGTGRACAGAGLVAAQGPPLPSEEILTYFERNIEALEQAAQSAQDQGLAVLAEDLRGSAAAVRKMAAEDLRKNEVDLEEVERNLSALEERLAASVTRAAPLALIVELRQEVERGIVPHRRRMTATEAESLER